MDYKYVEKGRMMNSDLDVLKKGRPYLRGILAFLICMCKRDFSDNISKEAYSDADGFIEVLERDIRSSK